MDKINVIMLREMSYKELKVYAKKFNIKCNLKANKLIDAILEKVGQHNNDSNNSSMFSESSDLADNNITVSVATSKVKEQKDIDKGVAALTPAAVSKTRRLTYELTPETTKVLDVDTAKDVAKDNPVNATAAVTTTPKTVAQASSKKEEPLNVRSKIPVQGKKTGARVCATPNFKKLHEREFSKMDSLDVYVAKKEARGEKQRRLPQSVKSVRSLGLKFAKQNPVEESKIFKPSVLSTSTMNLNFVPIPRTRQAKANAVKSKIPTFSACTVSVKRLNFAGESLPKSIRTPLQKIPIPSKNTITKPTFRYQPPKCQEKEAVVNGTGARKPVREKTRSMLKGVRLNKRFELQLEARGIVLK